MRLRSCLVSLTLAIVVLAVDAQHGEASAGVRFDQGFATDEVKGRLQEVLQSEFEQSSAAPGILARMDAPEVHWASAFGVDDLAAGTVLRPTQSFRCSAARP